jgi:TatA/E family protein of Tat protein translocase
MSTCPSTLAFIEGIGGPELLMIMFVVLLLFGGQKLPELARGLGKSLREFKKAASGVEEEFKRAIEDTPETPAPPPARAKTATERQEPPHT